MPYRIQLPAEILHQLSARAEETMSHSRSNIELDSLLLFIFRQITLHEALATPADIPVWLVRAIQEYTTPDLFRRGCAGFAGLCGRNGDYVNRTVRLHFGKSLTELTNELKIRHTTRHHRHADQGDQFQLRVPEPGTLLQNFQIALQPNAEKIPAYQSDDVLTHSSGTRSGRSVITPSAPKAARRSISSVLLTVQ